MFIYIKQNIKQLDCKCIISKATTDCGFYFEVLFKGRPSRGALSRAINRCDRCFRLPIVCDGVCLPKELRPRQLNTERFDTILLINAFSDVISGHSKALVIDPDGLLCDNLLLPLTKVGTLYVLTRRPDIYEQSNRRALRTVGSSAILLESIYDFSPFCAVLMPFGTGGIYREPHHNFLFGQGGFVPFGNDVIFRKQHCDRLLMAAFYSELQDKRAGLCTPALLYRNERTISPQGLKIKLDSIRDIRL